MLFVIFFLLCRSAALSLSRLQLSSLLSASRPSIMDNNDAHRLVQQQDSLASRQQRAGRSKVQPNFKVDEH
jgi:hypothetical protein